MRMAEEKVPCPSCGAKAGDPCLMPNGKPARTFGVGGFLPTVHVKRMEAYSDADPDGTVKRFMEMVNDERASHRRSDPR